MKALILAGGKGTRLRSVIGERPKPMALIGGRPFLCYLLDRLADAGLCDVTLSLGYKADVIRAYFGTRYRGLDLRYVEEASPLGTGGAIRAALSGQGDTPYLVMNGDTIFDVRYRELFECWRGRPRHIAVAATRLADCGRYGRVIVRDGILTGFMEKASGGEGLVNAGLYILTEQNLRADEMPRQYSFETEFLQRHLAALAPTAFISSGYFIDIGVPDDFRRAQSELASIFP